MPERLPRAVFFDLDDTLCDYSGAREARLRIAFGLAFCQANREAPERLVDRMVSESISIHPHASDHFGHLLARHGIDQPDAAAAAVNWYRQNRFHGLDLFPDALGIIGRVRSIVVQGGTHSVAPVGIITNGPADVQRAKLERLGMNDHVDFALVSGEFGLEKPAPEIFREALRIAAVDPIDALFVGDSLEFDIAGASRTGMRSIWINRRGVPLPTGNDTPTLVIASLSELPDVLSGIRT